MKELLIKILDLMGWAYWVEVITDKPNCTYYFGPFVTAKEAKQAQPGYVEDLESEGAQGISVSIKRCKPTDLTIFDESGESTEFQGIARFTRQLS